MPKQLTSDQIRELLGEFSAHRLNALLPFWCARGGGAAVYRNEDLGHYDLGAVKIVSFGAPEAQLEDDEPPTRLPDIGGDINWRYQLVGVIQ